MTRVYNKSEELLERALRTIPLGSQTFSKSKTQYPVGAAPLFIERGRGARVWDVDGNEYVDWVSSLLAITLGHGDPDVNRAVQEQLADGVLFSLPHRLEMEVAELIVKMVPCAQKVRFGKNGSDATSGAVRIARAFTGRDRIAVCGYHGWQDWYIGSTARSLGVPEATRALTHTWKYNEVDSLEAILKAHPNEFAAVIMEPMNLAWPKEGFLSEVLALTHAHGALLVFDETITGFRYSAGGAQELFGVTPDLATFGKGLANGFPLSALVGRADVMALMEEVFFSFTFGGETLSLAAAKAVLNKLATAPVLETIHARGTRVIDGLNALVRSAGVDEWLATAGHPSWSFLTISPQIPLGLWPVKTLMMQELLAQGVLSLGSHNVSYSHTDADVDGLLRAYAHCFEELKRGLKIGSLDGILKTAPLQPLFVVR